MNVGDAQQLVDEFKLFIAERVSNKEILEKRIAIARTFLLDPFVAQCRLSKRIKFLTMKGFSRPEIEGALELVSERDFLRYAEDEIQDSDEDNERAKRAAAEAMAKGDAAAAAEHLKQQTSSLENNELSDAALWRIGGNVYAFKGENSYFCVPLIGFDHTRHEDIFIVAHQLEDGRFGPQQYLHEGFKGVVPDEYPPHELLEHGQTVIAEYPDSYRAHYKEAVIVGVSIASHVTSSAAVDGGVTVDLEWVHNSEVTRGIPSHHVRMLHHPKKLLFQREIEEAERRRNQGAGERTQSTSSFPYRPVGGHFTGSERCRRTEQLKNFIHYPHLDLGEQPRSVQNGNAYVSQFGETFPDGTKTYPICPPSQAGCTGNAFGFNLSMFERDSACPHFFTTNPILEITEQCAQRDSMFVDPDFPPSFTSINGPSGESNVEFSWRRASELSYRPRLTVMGSKSIEITPGYFSPLWMLSAFGALDAVAEFEEMISPGEDGWVFGAYVVRLFINGVWGFVVVDDFIPCDGKTGKPLSLMSGSPNELYPCLLEKALAKLEGSYMALKYSRPTFSLQTVWERLTSNILEVMDHDFLPAKDSANENLQAFVRQPGSFKILARCRPETATDERYSGFGFDDDSYWMIDAISVYVPPTRTQPKYYFHVARATRGGSPVTHIDIKREKFFRAMPREAIDGFGEVPSSSVSYWISSSEYYSIFDRTACLCFINNSQRTSIEGSFAGRDSGPKMSGTASWLRNPQIFVSFVQPSEVIIEIKLKDRSFNKNSINGRGLQLHLLKGPPIERPFTEEDAETIQDVAASPMIDLAEDVEAFSCPSSSIRLLLNGGNYIIVPNVGCASNEDFVIKIFSISAFYMKHLN